MKKIAIITPGKLPVPAVKGGAVETLVQILIDRNEITPNFIFTVYSNHSKEAECRSRHYRFTTFSFIKSDGVLFNTANWARRVVNFILLRIHKKYVGDQFITLVIKALQKGKFEAVLLENNSLYAVPVKQKTGLLIIQHLHNHRKKNSASWDSDINKATDKVFAISDYLKQEYISQNGNGRSGPLMATWYNGIYTERFAERNENELHGLRNKLGILKEDTVILFSGRLQPYKGIKELLQAFCKIRNLKHCKLLIVGADTFSSSAKTGYIKGLYQIAGSVFDNVIFTGYIEYAAIHQFYAIADFAVLPSMWEEPLGLTCLEALSAALPVIITDSGGMVELVDADSAIIVRRNKELIDTLAQKIDELVEDRCRRLTMSVAALKRAAQFTETIYFNRFTDLYNKFCEENG